ncbi:MAG: hypothetical protein ACE5JZ_06615 [Kiloniellales bacterium]
MLSTRLGSPDGIETRRYLGGETYDLPPSLAKVFLGEGWAELVVGRPAFAKPASAGEGRKDAGAAPQNKALAGAPENRALFHVRHRGGGRWWVMDGIEKVRGPYASRAEAEAHL